MSIKDDLAYLLQILQHQEIIVLSPDLRLMLTDVLTAYENLYYELEKWKSNYQYHEKESHAKSIKCTKYHIVDYSRKQQYISHVKEYKCGICSSKLNFDKFVERYEKDRFLCDICLRTHHVSSGVYYCSHCSFDVCAKCPEVLNVEKLNKCPKCSAKIHHVHCLPEEIAGKYSCFVCDGDFLDTDGVYICEHCEYRMCPACEKTDRKNKLFKEIKASSTFNRENNSFSPEKLLHMEKVKRNLNFNETPQRFDKEQAKKLNLERVPFEINEQHHEKELITFGDRGNQQKNEKSVLEVINELEKLDKFQKNPQSFEEKNKNEDLSSISFTENKQVYENSPKIQEVKGDFPLNLFPYDHATSVKIVEKPVNYPVENSKEKAWDSDNEYSKMFRKI